MAPNMVGLYYCVFTFTLTISLWWMESASWMLEGVMACQHCSAHEPIFECFSGNTPCESFECLWVYIPVDSWINQRKQHLPSGKHSKNYGKSPFLIGKSTISMAIFNSYVELPEGIYWSESLILAPLHIKNQSSHLAFNEFPQPPTRVDTVFFTKDACFLDQNSWKPDQ